MMRRPRVRITVKRMMLLVAATAALLGLLFVLLGDRTAEIRVVNLTGRPLIDVEVTVGGRVLTADRLDPGTSARWTIRPSGYRYGSPFGVDLRLRCRDDRGMTYGEGSGFGAVFRAIDFEPTCRFEVRPGGVMLGGSGDRPTPKLRRLARTYLTFGVL